jgi:hypothetical protein
MGKRFSDKLDFDPYCEGIEKMVEHYDEHKDAEAAIKAAEMPLDLLEAYNPKLSVEQWHERWLKDKRYGCQHDGAVKRIAFIGLDHAEYLPKGEEFQGINYPTYDINGKPCQLPWHWMVGQYEIRLFTRMANSRLGTEFYNCTEGGIVYDDEFGIIQNMTFQQYIAHREQLESGGK